jgi:Protein of unknown function (DUF2569)
MAYTDGPTGIGGWMWLFLFGFALVSPLMLVFGTYTNLYADGTVAAMLGSRWVIYQVAEWGIVALGLGVIGFTVWRLFNVRTPQTVRLTIIAIPVVALGLALLDILFTAVIGEVDAGLLFSELGIELFRGAIYCAVWCSYFTVSKRVANTYLRPETDEAREIFA